MLCIELVSASAVVAIGIIDKIAMTSALGVRYREFAINYVKDDGYETRRKETQGTADAVNVGINGTIGHRRARNQPCKQEHQEANHAAGMLLAGTGHAYRKSRISDGSKTKNQRQNKVARLPSSAFLGAR